MIAGWRLSVSRFSETGFAVHWKSLPESPLSLVLSLGRRGGAMGYSLHKPKVLTLSFQSIDLKGAVSFYHSHVPSVRLLL